MRTQCTPGPNARLMLTQCSPNAHPMLGLVGRAEMLMDDFGCLVGHAGTLI